jgi:hypothetical protein
MTTGAWPAPLTGGSTADGMIKRWRVREHKAMTRHQLADVPVACPIERGIVVTRGRPRTQRHGR